MAEWGSWVDMEMDDESQLDTVMPMAMERPRFPPGLMIHLRDEQLKALGLDTDCDEGMELEFSAVAVVRSVHKEDGNCCVMLQIEKMRTEEED